MAHKEARVIEAFSHPDHIAVNPSGDDAARQASRLTHDSIESQKNRDADKEAAKAKALDDERKRVASLKITQGATNYTNTANENLRLGNEALWKQQNGVDPNVETHVMGNNIAIDAVQKKKQTEQEAQNDKNLSTFGEGVWNPTEIRNATAGYNQPHIDLDTRAEMQAKVDKELGDNAHMHFNPTGKFLLSTKDDKPQKFTYTDNVSLQGNVHNDQRENNSYYPIKTKKQLLDSKNNPMVDSDGNPIYESRKPVNAQEILPIAEKKFDSYSNDEKNLIKKRILHDEKDELEKRWEVYRKTNLSSPLSPETQKMLFMENEPEKIAKQKLADVMWEKEKMLNNDYTTTRATPKPDKEDKEKQKDKNAGISESNNAGTFFKVAGKGGNFVQAEFNDQTKTSKNHQYVGGITVQGKDGSNNITDAKPINVSLGESVRNLNTNENIPLTGNELVSVKSLIPSIYHINSQGRRVRATFSENATLKDYENAIRNTPKGQKVEVDPEVIANLYLKNNTSGGMTDAELTELARLEKMDKKNFKTGEVETLERLGKSKNLTDPQKVKLQELRAKDPSVLTEGDEAKFARLKGKKDAQAGKTIRTHAEKSGILKDVTGYGSVQDIADDDKLGQDVRGQARVQLHLMDLAKKHNSGDDISVETPKNTGTSNSGLTKGVGKGLSDKEVEANKKAAAVASGSFNDIYKGNHMTYVDIANKHTGNTDDLLSKFADWEKNNEGGRGGGYNWGTNDPSVNTKEKAIGKYKKEYLPMVKDLPYGVKNIGLQQAINVGDPWGAALTAAGVYNEKGNSVSAGVRGDNRRAKKQESVYDANKKAVFESYNKDPEAFKERYLKAVKYHYDNAKPIGTPAKTEADDLGLK